MRGDWGDSGGIIDSIHCLTVSQEPETEEKVFEGGEFEAGKDLTLYVDEAAYNVVSFDYKFTSGTKMWFGLYNSEWTKYYGYLGVDGNGLLEEYEGITCQKLENGYIRVTMDLTKVNKTNGGFNRNNAPASIALLYVRGDWGDSNGIIDNITVS